MRKLQVAEIDFLFRVGFLLDSSVCDKYFGILIEHFCDNAESPGSPGLAALTSEGYTDNE